MASKWKYNLGASGQALKNAINDGREDAKSCINTMQCIVVCLKKLQKTLHEEMFLNYFDEVFDDAKDVLEGFETESIGLPEHLWVSVVNSVLGAFYDACDECRVWIG